jgi:hypothetical protein
MKRVHTARFFRVPRTTHATSAGLVDLPILYFDTTMVTAFFQTPVAGVEQVLAGSGLVPALVRDGRAAWGLVFYQYRDTSVGAYHEVGVAVFVVRGGEPRPRLGLFDLMRSPRKRQIGMFVVDLPVTTELALKAGRELWGYPKFVTEIPFRLEKRHFDGAVLDPAGASEILRLRGDFARGVPVPPLSLMTYTFLNDELIRTPIDVRGVNHLHASGSVELEVGASEHPMAERLRKLCGAGTRPVFVAVSDRFQSKLHAGHRLEPNASG